ncbi:DUF4912 domain-containing protein [Candidatus Margulisiibacteriota bacterium]
MNAAKKKVVRKKTVAKKKLKPFTDRFFEYTKSVLAKRKKKKNVQPAQNAYPISPSPVIQKFIKEQEFQFPAGYGENRAVLMVRDAHWLFAYWEVMPGINGLTLRVINEDLGKHFDINVQSAGTGGSWYINCGLPDTRFSVLVGYYSKNGKFNVIVKSNIVQTPRDRVSDVIDEEWMAVDWDKIYSLSGGQRLKSGASSGVFTSIFSGQ